VLLKVLATSIGSWKILAQAEVQDGEVVCAFENELLALAAEFPAVVEGLYAWWEQIPREGPRKLGTAVYHYVNKDEQIYEFVKGQYRFFCFQGDGALCICATSARKKRQEVDPKIVRRVTALKDQYFAEAAVGTIQIHEGD
jgi:hypothetical protein